MDEKTKKILGIIIVVIILFLGYRYLSQAPQREEAESVTIGFMGPLTGDAASYGESIKRGVELAHKEQGSEIIHIVYEDSRCSGDDAANAINKLISVDKVAAVIGEVCSGATLAAAPIAESKKVVLISPASTNPKISDAGEYIFRVVPSDTFQASFGAKLVYDRGFRKLAVLYSNEEYGVGFEEVLKDSFKNLGGEVVASESFETDTQDVRTQLTKIKAAGPDAIYIISNAPKASVAALNQIQELDIEVQIFASEGLKSDEILEGAGESAEGMILTSVSAGTPEFIQKHKDEYGVGPGPFAAQGYDAYQALARVIQSGARTGEEIRDALQNVEFEGASGFIEFDANGDVSGNYEVLIVRDQAFVPLKEVEGDEEVEGDGGDEEETTRDSEQQITNGF